MKNVDRELTKVLEKIQMWKDGELNNESLSEHIESILEDVYENGYEDGEELPCEDCIDAERDAANYEEELEELKIHFSEFIEAIRTKNYSHAVVIASRGGIILTEEDLVP